MRKHYFNSRTFPSLTPAASACAQGDGGHAGIPRPVCRNKHPRLQLLSFRVHNVPMPRTAVRDGLCRLCTYLEELEAVELKKFKLFLGTATEMRETRIPWGRMETAGPLEMAQLLVAHCGIGEAWLLALSIFDRINRKDLWERGQREDLVRGKEVVMGPSRLEPTNSLLSDNRWAHKAWVLTYPLGLCSCCVLPETPFLCLFCLKNSHLSNTTLKARPSL